LLKKPSSPVELANQVNGSMHAPMKEKSETQTDLDSFVCRLIFLALEAETERCNIINRLSEENPQFSCFSKLRELRVEIVGVISVFDAHFLNQHEQLKSPNVNIRVTLMKICQMLSNFF
jgi:hypothetical protein